MELFATNQLTRSPQGHDLLGIAVQGVWGLSPLPECVPAPGGKPYFPQYPEHCFNLSHSGRYAMCAVDGQPVGVDIQIIKTTWRHSLPRRVCNDRQFHWLTGQPDFWRGFTRLWAMKESRVKWDGSGLTHSIADISVPLPRDEEFLYFMDGLWFRLFSGPDWEACVCSASPPPDRLHWVDLPAPPVRVDGEIMT